LRVQLKHLAKVALRFLQMALLECILPALKNLRGISRVVSLAGEEDEAVEAELCPFGAGAACPGGMAIAISTSRSKIKPFDVIRALDTGMTLCCSVRQCTLSVQALTRTLKTDGKLPGRVETAAPPASSGQAMGCPVEQSSTMFGIGTPWDGRTSGLRPDGQPKAAVPTWLQDSGASPFQREGCNGDNS
jgi:hypothetical protein